jgi:hypothetical protein
VIFRRAFSCPISSKIFASSSLTKQKWWQLRGTAMNFEEAAPLTLTMRYLLFILELRRFRHQQRSWISIVPFLRVATQSLEDRFWNYGRP